MVDISISLHGVGKEQSSDLDVAEQVVLDGSKSCRTKDICNGRALVSNFRHAVKQQPSPNSVTRASAASRNSAVEMALSLAASIGTSAKDFWMVSNQVPPAGIEPMIADVSEGLECRKQKTTETRDDINSCHSPLPATQASGGA